MLEPRSNNTPPILHRNLRKNLPDHGGTKRTESLFGLSFARAFTSIQLNSPLFLAREVPMNGYGIADLVCLMNTTASEATLLAFEIKIRDWRKALSQAYRYRFFSNISIVVIPFEDASRAKIYLDTFKALEVGLWSYDKKSEKIHELYTPKYHRPLHPPAKLKALKLLDRSS